MYGSRYTLAVFFLFMFTAVNKNSKLKDYLLSTFYYNERAIFKTSNRYMKQVKINSEKCATLKTYTFNKVKPR